MHHQQDRTVKPTRPQGRLVRQWRGHEVEISERGLSIDGRTVDPAPLTAEDAVRPNQDPRTHPSLQFLPGGALVYRGHVQAELHPGGLTVHGPSGAEWPTGPQPEQRQRLAREEPTAGPAPPEADDDLDIGF